MASPTLRELTGMDPNPAPISNSALVLIDCQQTYREGVMQLENVEPALQEAAALLKRFREAGRPVIHIVHDAGEGTPYDVTAPIGQIADVVAPVDGESVIIKTFPSAFEQTELDVELKKHGIENVVYAGFMTHMCVRTRPPALRSITATPTPWLLLPPRRGQFQIPPRARTSRPNNYKTRACQLLATCSPW